MSAAVPRESAESPARSLTLRTLRGKGEDVWTAQLSDGLFSLHASDSRLVMMLPSEAAARHIRFQRDLVHGQTVRVNVLEGLKSHIFKASEEDLEALLQWLPHRTAESMAQEVRQYGVALILLGAAHLLFQATLYWGWGLALIGAGAVGALRPARLMYLVNGVVLGFIGLMLLFVQPQGLESPGSRLLYTALGSLLLLWAIQQFSLLGPQHRLLTVHDTQREALSPGQRHGSRLVKMVAVAAGILACIFALYAAGVYSSARAAAAVSTDFVVFAGLAVLMAFSACVLLLRRYPPYLEAKITAQLMIVVAVLYGWGLAAGLALGDPFAFSQGILSAGLLRFEQPYVWAPLVILLLLFGRWFTLAAEREALREE